MVRIVAAMGRQIKSHTESLLPGCQYLFIKRVALLDRTEPGVLQMSAIILLTNTDLCLLVGWSMVDGCTL